MHKTDFVAVPRIEGYCNQAMTITIEKKQGRIGESSIDRGGLPFPIL
jgi:hypothetical protein